jgi:hypothetical protein
MSGPKPLYEAIILADVALNNVTVRILSLQEHNRTKEIVRTNRPYHTRVIQALGKLHLFRELRKQLQGRREFFSFLQTAVNVSDKSWPGSSWKITYSELVGICKMVLSK